MKSNKAIFKSFKKGLILALCFCLVALCFLTITYASAAELSLASGESHVLTDGDYNLTVNATKENPAVISGGSYKGNLTVNGENFIIKNVFFEGGSLTVNGKNVKIESCSFTSFGAVSLSGEEITLLELDFFKSSGVKLKNVNGAAVKNCFFTLCESGIVAENVDFSYISSGGKFGNVKNTDFYGCKTAISLLSCEDVYLEEGTITGSETGISLNFVDAFKILNCSVFKNQTGINLSKTNCIIETVLFYNNVLNVKNSGENTVKALNSASVGNLFDVSAGITEENCKVFKENEFKNRFSFNKAEDYEGFLLTMGVRVEVSGGSLNFEPDNNYLYIENSNLFLNNRLFSKAELKFKEAGDIYGELSVKTFNNAPWISGSANKIIFEKTKDRKSYITEPFRLTAMTSEISLKLSLVGRFELDYIAFLPDIDFTAEYLNENTVKITLTGNSSPVFSGENGFEVSGINASFTPVFKGGKTVLLVFDKNVENEMKRAEITIKPEALYETFASLLSGKDVLGRSPSEEKEALLLETEQDYLIEKISGKIAVPAKDLMELAIELGIAVLIIGVISAAVAFAFIFFKKRNQLNKFAKKGRRALRNRRKAKKF